MKGLDKFTLRKATEKRSIDNKRNGERRGKEERSLRYILGVITGVSLTLYAVGLIVAAYLERGYIAAGGEWVLIILGSFGLVGCGYRLRDHQARESRARIRKMKERKIRLSGN